MNAQTSSHLPCLPENYERPANWEKDCAEVLIPKRSPNENCRGASWHATSCDGAYLTVKYFIHMNAQTCVYTCAHIHLDSAICFIECPHSLP